MLAPLTTTRAVEVCCGYGERGFAGFRGRRRRPCSVTGLTMAWPGYRHRAQQSGPVGRFEPALPQRWRLAELGTAWQLTFEAAELTTSDDRVLPRRRGREHQLLVADSQRCHRRRSPVSATSSTTRNVISRPSCCWATRTSRVTGSAASAASLSASQARIGAWSTCAVA